MTIKALMCRVLIKGKSKKTASFGEAKPVAPSLQFVSASIASAFEAERAGEDEEASAEASHVEQGSAGADPKAVADKVYDLMKEELRTSHMRGQS